VLKFIEMIETSSTVYLVTEELKGPELFEVLVNRDRPFDEGDTLIFVEQMLKAIEACHKKDFAHLDVKIENIVFREKSLNSPLVLVDFGAAQKFIRAPYADKSDHYIEGLDDETRELTATRPAGTIPYNSPEVLNGLFSSRSDVWSVGVSMFVLLTGRRPFESGRNTPLEAEKSVARQIKWHGGTRNRPPRQLPIPDGICSPETQRFLTRLTMGHPRDRLSATEAIAAISQLPLFRQDRKVLTEL
jgi:serine/threonine protein kinase